MSKKKILIVEDEKNIAELVTYNLEKSGFDCVTTNNGEDALVILQKHEIDLVILDIMLPQMDGLEACRRIRRGNRTSSTPIIMLTAKGEETDRIVGFELGANDYVVKPFSPRELVLRVKSILNYTTQKAETKEILTMENLTVDIAKHKVFVNNEDIKLTAMEFKLLVLLMQRKGRVQSRDVLLEDIWDMSTDVTTRTIDTHVKCLRHKLGEIGSFIETVRGLGYRFKEGAD